MYPSFDLLIHCSVNLFISWLLFTYFSNLTFEPYKFSFFWILQLCCYQFCFICPTRLSIIICFPPTFFKSLLWFSYFTLYLLVFLSVSLLVNPSNSLSVCLIVSLFVWLTVGLSFYLHVYWFLCLCFQHIYPNLELLICLTLIFWFLSILNFCFIYSTPPNFCFCFWLLFESLSKT